ncbi:MAG: hypothetical protein WCJ24_02650 [Candidatus Saccharibacteria bacterium]
MNKLKNNQSGFGALELILIIVVVGLLGLVGWYVFNKNNSKTTNKIGSAQKQAASDVSSPYLEIKELSVKLKLTNSTEDMTYHIDNASFFVVKI